MLRSSASLLSRYGRSGSAQLPVPRTARNVVLRRWESTQASTPTTPAAEKVATQAVAAPKTGSPLLQRLTGFFVGSAFGFGLAFHFVYEELLDSNASFDAQIKSIESRVKALEK